MSKEITNEELCYVRNNLIIVGLDSITAKRYIMSLHPTKVDIPSQSFTGNFNELFLKYAIVDPSWANLKLLGCFINHTSDTSLYKTVNIFVGCIIPFDLEIKDAYWIELDPEKIQLTEELLSVLRTM